MEKIGIIGINGRYGIWFKEFFKTQMGLDVVGSDIVGDTDYSSDHIVSNCDIILFAVPLEDMATIVSSYRELARPDQLWIEISSHKEQVINEALKSKAELLGIHPMCAPPKNHTLIGNNVIACKIRLNKWRDWVDKLLKSLNGNVVNLDVDTHDRMMGVVQSLPHAMYIGALKTIIRSGLDIETILKLSTPPFKLAWATMSRMHTNNPYLYAEIQIQNGSILLREYSREIDKIISFIDGNKIDLLRNAINKSFDAIRGYDFTKRGAVLFQQIIDTVSDIEKGNAVYIYSPKVKKGYLQMLLSYFTDNDITLSSAHSFPKPPGYVFLFGVDCSLESANLVKCLKEIKRDHEELEITENSFN